MAKRSPTAGRDKVLTLGSMSMLHLLSKPSLLCQNPVFTLGETKICLIFLQGRIKVDAKR